MIGERNSRGWSWSWSGIILVVLIVFGFFQMIRVNPPDDRLVNEKENKVIWTEGTVVSGALEVAANGYLTYPINFNKKSSLDGVFTTGDSKKRLACSIIAAADLERWKAGDEVAFVNNTGQVPRGIVRRTIDPGYYLLIFDNRMNQAPIRIVESNFTVK